MKARRTKALEIPPEVKKAVSERDGGACLWCAMRGEPNAHILRRSRGGRGIETNIVTLCWECHRKFDESGESKKIMDFICMYMKQHYGEGWSIQEQKYKKGE